MDQVGRVTIGGATWSVEELDRLVIAARAVVRGAKPIELDRGEVMAVPERPTLWELMTALDRQRARELRERREAEEAEEALAEAADSAA